MFNQTPCTRILHIYFGKQNVVKLGEKEKLYSQNNTG